tara:strand:- start:18846 stop:20147 length:1302 start_codon:yes stop_codon:yes gene_type:complete
MKLSREELQFKIKDLFREWAETEKPLKKIRYAGPSLDGDDYSAMLDAVFSNWWSGGKYTLQAERDLANFSHRENSLLVNSGSSANLVLISGIKQFYNLEDGDKVLTLSCGFPTTVNPIIQNRLIPVFVDIDLTDLSMNPEVLEESLKNDSKIKILFIAHTLGFHGDLERLISICEKYGVIPLFDCCDAYLTEYKGKPIQSYGVAATFSFYVAHDLTSGEGGGIVTDNKDLHICLRGIRNWGRYCAAPNCCIRSKNPEVQCPTKKLTESCRLPDDYIVNYQYEWLGYNLKMLDLQAAMLSSQLKKAKKFSQIRKRNYKMLYDYFSKNVDCDVYNLEKEVSPFAFPIILPKGSSRKNFINHLSKNKIESRLLFGGNLMDHPAYEQNSKYWESIGEHKNSNIIRDRMVMIGVSQILSEEQIKTIIKVCDEYFIKRG